MRSFPPFSSLPPACGSCPEAQESRRTVGAALVAALGQAVSRRMAACGQPQGLPLQNRRNKARMSMKTKGNDKWSLRAAGGASPLMSAPRSSPRRLAPGAHEGRINRMSAAVAAQGAKGQWGRRHRRHCLRRPRGFSAGAAEAAPLEGFPGRGQVRLLFGCRRFTAVGDRLQNYGAGSAIRTHIPEPREQPRRAAGRRTVRPPDLQARRRASIPSPDSECARSRR